MISRPSEELQSAALEYLSKQIVYNARCEHVKIYQALMEKAKDHFTNALELKKKDQTQAKIEFENAIICCTQMLSMNLLSDNNYVLTYLLRGMCYHAVGQIELALQDFKKTLEYEPLNYHANKYCSVLYKKLGDMELARKHLDIALKNQVNAARMIFLQNYVEQYHERLQVFRQAIVDDVKNITKEELKNPGVQFRAFKQGVNLLDVSYTFRAERAAGLVYDARMLSKTDLKAALAKYHESVEIIPHEDVYANMGCMYQQLGDLENAFKFLRCSIELKPKTQAHYALATLHKEQKNLDLMRDNLCLAFGYDLEEKELVDQYAETCVDYLDLLKKTSLKPLKYQKLKDEVHAELKRDDFSKTIQLLNQCLDQDPTNNVFYVQRGLMHFHLHRYRDALRDYNTAFWLYDHLKSPDPSLELPDYFRGRRNVFVKLGKLDDALKDHDILITDYKILGLRRGERLGTVKDVKSLTLHLSRKFYQGRTRLQFKEDEDKDFAKLLLEKARELISEEQHDHAILFLNKACEILKTNENFLAECFLELAVAYRAVAKLAEAKEVFEKAQKIAPLHKRVKKELYLPKPLEREVKKDKPKLEVASNQFPKKPPRRKLAPKPPKEKSPEESKIDGAAELQAIKDAQRTQKNKKKKAQHRQRKVVIIQQAEIRKQEEAAEKSAQIEEQKLMSQEDRWLAVDIVMQDIEIKIIQALKSKGAIAALGGSSVRDRIWHKVVNPKKDIDIVTNAKEKDILEIFSGYGIYPVAVKPGLFKIKELDIDIFRSDSIEEGFKQYAENLDFTANALFADENGKVIDPLGAGVTHVKFSELHSIKDPLTSFQEDPIRILRAIHATTTSKIKLSQPVANAIKQKSPELKKLTEAEPKKVNACLHKLFSKGHAAENFKKIIQWGLLDKLFPKAADALFKDQDWIIEQLKESDKRPKVSLNYIYMCFIVSATMQSVHLDKNIIKRVIKENPLFETNFASGFGIANLSKAIIPKWNAQAHPSLNASLNTGSTFYQPAKDVQHSQQMTVPLRVPGSLFYP